MIYLYIITGVFIGWITKVPFLYRWYRELKQTKDYQKARRGVELYDMIEKYNKLYPNSPIKHKK